MSKRKKANIESNGRPDRIPVHDLFVQQMVDLNQKMVVLREQGNAIMVAAQSLLKVPCDYVLDVEQKAFVPPEKTPESKA